LRAERTRNGVGAGTSSWGLICCATCWAGVDQQPRLVAYVERRLRKRSCEEESREGELRAERARDGTAVDAPPGRGLVSCAICWPGCGVDQQFRLVEYAERRLRKISSLESSADGELRAEGARAGLVVGVSEDTLADATFWPACGVDQQPRLVW